MKSKYAISHKEGDNLYFPQKWNWLWFQYDNMPSEKEVGHIAAFHSKKEAGEYIDRYDILGRPSIATKEYINTPYTPKRCTIVAD